MGGAREDADIFWRLSGRWSNGKWRGLDLFHRRFWRNPYVWHDTIGKRFARLFTCRFFGHTKLRNINDPGEPPRMYCFRCERSPPTTCGADNEK